MRIFYPYNEILPRKKAHDVFIFHECAALAKLGWNVTLLCGKGSNQCTLFEHYQTSTPFTIAPLPIIRKNNFLNLSWNLPFFYNCQQKIKRDRPDYVFLSVRKQAGYHFAHKQPKVRYLYEVHELCYYPNQVNPKGYVEEKKILSQADLITVTTDSLKEILKTPPYSLKVPIEVVPLAVHAKPLPPPPIDNPLTVMYIGQLYSEQGIHTLLKALTHVTDVQLKILGGSSEEIDNLQRLARSLQINHAVEFLGFVPPSELPNLAKHAHAFVAPFGVQGRMPFVAHTKLFEYAQLGRPMIVPDLPIVTEHFSDGEGVLLFNPDDSISLADKINALKCTDIRDKLQQKIAAYADRFSWEKRAEHYQRLLS